MTYKWTAVRRRTDRSRPSRTVRPTAPHTYTSSRAIWFAGRLSRVVYSNGIPSWTPALRVLAANGLGPQWSKRNPIPAACSALPMIVIRAALASPCGNPYPPHTQIT